MARIKKMLAFAVIAVRTSSAYAASVQNAIPQPPGIAANAGLPSIQWRANKAKPTMASESW